MLLSPRRDSMPPPTEIKFVRHGEVHNPRRVLYGRLPRFRLSRRGREQAAALAAALAKVSVQAVVSSPLLRARQTAAFLLEGRANLRLTTAAQLNEVLTPYQGRTEGELEAPASAVTYAVAGDPWQRHRFIDYLAP